MGTREHLSAIATILAALCGCSPTEPADDGPEEYSIVISAPAGVVIAGELSAYALVKEAGEPEHLVEVRETHEGESDGTDDVRSATRMIRDALDGGTLRPPPDAASGLAPLASPVTVVVDGDTARVIGMKLHFMKKLGGAGVVSIRGMVNDEEAWTAVLSVTTDVAEGLVLGSDPFS